MGEDCEELTRWKLTDLKQTNKLIFTLHPSIKCLLREALKSHDTASDQNTEPNVGGSYQSRTGDFALQSDLWRVLWLLNARKKYKCLLNFVYILRIQCFTLCCLKRFMPCLGQVVVANENLFSIGLPG